MVQETNQYPKGTCVHISTSISFQIDYFPLKYVKKKIAGPVQSSKLRDLGSVG
jgi:hypothetical protein